MFECDGLPFTDVKSTIKNRPVEYQSIVIFYAVYFQSQPGIVETKYLAQSVNDVKLSEIKNQIIFISIYRVVN